MVLKRRHVHISVRLMHKVVCVIDDGFMSSYKESINNRML